MIPKIIHFCWLSDDDYPNSIKECLESWQKFLPDYEFIHWDTKRFNLESNIWVKQAFEEKKYAFAADYIRLYAVYNYGGIYLDMDVEVLKKFDDLLNLPYFIGSEGGGIIEAGVFGAVAKTSWIGDCLNYYSDKSFINLNGSFNTLTLPRIMMAQITENREVIQAHMLDFSISEQYSDDNFLIMLPKDFFCAKNQGTGVIETTNNTYCIHHFAMSWVPKSNLLFLSNFKRALIKIFGVKVISTFIDLMRLKQIKNFFINL